MERSGRGRQEEARRNDQAVLDAARLVFAVHGPDAPVSAVAATAGVGMGTLYRRYPTKEALLQYLCVASLEQQVEAALAALARDDAWQALAGFIRACVSFRAGVFTSIAGSVSVTPAMQAAARQAHDLVERLVGRARQAGLLGCDVSSVDIHLLIELFSRRRPGAEAGHERLLAVALEGLRGADVLPGPAPTWDSYAKLWSGR